MANFFAQHRGNIPYPVEKPTIYHSNRTYEKGKRIASGGYGRVHKVTRPSDQRVFAMKTAKRHLNVQATIHKEIKLLSTLRHDSIISLEDEAGTTLEPCLIMEMASSNVAAEGSRWRGDEVVARVMSRQILAALMHIHRHNIAHRDVKADNILVFMSSTGSPTFKLADFGCAENIVPAGQFHPDPSSGIPAIEIQRHGTGIREHADMMDIYGFGLVLYGMLTQGSLPDVGRFDSLSARYEAAMRWKPENGRLRALSRAAMVFIDSLLASNPRARPGAEQMLKHTWLKTRMDVPDIAAPEPAVSSVPDIEKEAG